MGLDRHVHLHWSKKILMSDSASQLSTNSSDLGAVIDEVTIGWVETRGAKKFKNFPY